MWLITHTLITRVITFYFWDTWVWIMGDKYLHLHTLNTFNTTATSSVCVRSACYCSDTWMCFGMIFSFRWIRVYSSPSGTTLTHDKSVRRISATISLLSCMILSLIRLHKRTIWIASGVCAHPLLSFSQCTRERINDLRITSALEHLLHQVINTN